MKRPGNGLVSFVWAFVAAVNILGLINDVHYDKGMTLQILHLALITMSIFLCVSYSTDNDE